MGTDGLVCRDPRENFAMSEGGDFIHLNWSYPVFISYSLASCFYDFYFYHFYSFDFSFFDFYLNDLKFSSECRLIVRESSSFSTSFISKLIIWIFLPKLSKNLLVSKFQCLSLVVKYRPNQVQVNQTRVIMFKIFQFVFRLLFSTSFVRNQMNHQ